MPPLPSRLRTPPGAANLAPTILSLLLGAGFTLCLFLGMAHFGNLSPTVAPPEFLDLRAVAVPVEPPPPPRIEPVAAAVEPMPSTVTGFDLAPSDSPVRIAVSPPNLDALSSTIQLAPPARIEIGQLMGDFRPQADPVAFAQHVYQQNEVDRIPTVLFRNPPTIPSRYTRNGQSVRVTLLLLIDTEGAVTDVRVAASSGEPEVDDIVVENIKTWGFSPAIKKGHKVRCLLQQQYIFVRARQSKFQV